MSAVNRVATGARIRSRVSESILKARKAAETQILASGAPQSVLSVPTNVRYGPNPLYRGYDEAKSELASVAIRELGASRRVFLLNPYLNAEELDGLAHRIKILSKNPSLNSILLSNAAVTSKRKTQHHPRQEKKKIGNVLPNEERISTDDSIDPDRVLPTSVLEQDLRDSLSIFNDYTSPGAGQVWHVCGGYDASKLSICSPQERLQTLSAIKNLALAAWAGVSSLNPSPTRIPLITVPHGLITDGGYAVCMGSYVLATDDSSFVIRNPLRGLAFDPIGLSYILPRLGQEFHQPSAKYPVGSILALTGYEADAFDMVETGLATHYLETFRHVGTLERILCDLPSWELQKLVKPPSKPYTGKSTVDNLAMESDVNAQYRNVALSHLLLSLCTYDAAGQELSNTPAEDEAEFWHEEDPSLVLEHDRGQAYGDRESTLVNIAASFQSIFEHDEPVEGIMEQLREISSSKPEAAEEKAAADLAQNMLTNMESQSPLALLAVHRLMQLGRRKHETLERCMDREFQVQKKLICQKDYECWATSNSLEENFRGWKHKNVVDVTSDEIEELFQV